MPTGYLNKFCAWLKRPKIHPEMTSDTTMQEDSARHIAKRSPSVVIRRLPKLDCADDIRSATEVVIEDPCTSIYKRVKEPGAYLQYQKSLVSIENIR